MINDNDKYALVALRTRSNTDLAPTEVVQGVWAASKPLALFTTHWKEWLGSIRADHLGRCNVCLMAKMPSASPSVIDHETVELENRVWRAYVGLLLANPFAAEGAPLLMSGACEAGEVGVRRVRDLDRLFHMPLDPWHQIDAADFQRGVSLGEAWSAYLQAGPPDGSWRFNRAFALYVATRSLPEMVDRIHQYARCLEGLTVPPNRGGTGKNFAARLALFVGGVHQATFERLYKLRGEIEHLHENRYLEVFDRQMRIELWKDNCILEYVSRACITRILETPTLWPHFRSTSAVEAFWALHETDRQTLWGAPINPLLGLTGLDEGRIRDEDLGKP